MGLSESEARKLLEKYGQEHVLRFWNDLDDSQRAEFLEDIAGVDFALMERLIDKWVRNEPPAERFDEIVPVSMITCDAPDRGQAEAAGEQALRDGRVGLFLVAGGQGTRLGYDGPKGTYPIGPISGKSLFEFHAEKIHNLQNRYGCVLPWYIMVSNTNAEATRRFFVEHDYFGLGAGNVKFLTQRMVPCVDDSGKFMLAAPYQLSENPNGHGGCIPAMVENGVVEDARKRGVDMLSYFQVDNWAVKVADPVFIGYHVLRNAQMSSKNHRKNEVREAVGVHCLCDGEYHVIEYSELDIYTQLLETDDQGAPLFCAGNPAMHILSVDFVEQVYNNFERFPWHRAHKKIPYLDESGTLVKPDAPNGYKFETFVFDALRFIKHEPVALEIQRPGEYTPIKQFEGANSVVAARASMAKYWADWLEAAGAHIPRDDEGTPQVLIEISPQWAFSKAEFIEKTPPREWVAGSDIGIDKDGSLMK